MKRGPANQKAPGRQWSAPAKWWLPTVCSPSDEKDEETLASGAQQKRLQEQIMKCRLLAKPSTVMHNKTKPIVAAASSHGNLHKKRVCPSNCPFNRTSCTAFSYAAATTIEVYFSFSLCSLPYSPLLLPVLPLLNGRSQFEKKRQNI